MYAKWIPLLIGLCLVLPPSATAKQNKELDCLSKVVYHEARGEPLEGQRAVAYVVMNRTQNPQWPQDVCGVTLQPKQFSDFHLDIPIERASEAWKNALTVASNVYYQKVSDPTKGATFFFNPKKCSPYWKRGLTFVRDIGNHRFLRLKEEPND